MCLEELKILPAHVFWISAQRQWDFVRRRPPARAEQAVGCDIDEKAAGVALENGRMNGLFEDRLTFCTGDILTDATLGRAIARERYDLVLANIVADVIIPLIPELWRYITPDGVFICSGIIEGRQDDVATALASHGYLIKSERSEDGWHCFSAVFTA